MYKQKLIFILTLFFMITACNHKKSNSKLIKSKEIELVKIELGKSYSNSVFIYDIDSGVGMMYSLTDKISNKIYKQIESLERECNIGVFDELYAKPKQIKSDHKYEFVLEFNFIEDPIHLLLSKDGDISYGLKGNDGKLISLCIFIKNNFLTENDKNILQYGENEYAYLFLNKDENIFSDENIFKN